MIAEDKEKEDRKEGRRTGQTLQMNVLTLVGLGVGFIGTCFVAAWMLLAKLEPGDMMWATIIICSTTAVMFVFIGELNRREADRIGREQERDRKIREEMDQRVGALNDGISGIAASLAAAGGDRARLEAGQQQLMELFQHFLVQVGFDQATRATFAARWVAHADQDSAGGSGTLRLVPRKSQPEDGK